MSYVIISVSCRLVLKNGELILKTAYGHFGAKCMMQVFSISYICCSQMFVSLGTVG